MQLRKASARDGRALVGTILAMASEARLDGVDPRGSGPAGLEAAIVEGLADGTQAWFLCEERGEIVASAGAFLMITPLDGIIVGRRAVIVGVYTHPNHRGRGAARKVVEAAIDWCRTAGVALVRLQTTEAARPLYESMGFTTGDVMTLKL